MPRGTGNDALSAGHCIAMEITFSNGDTTMNARLLDVCMRKSQINNTATSLDPTGTSHCPWLLHSAVASPSIKQMVYGHESSLESLLPHEDDSIGWLFS